MGIKEKFLRKPKSPDVDPWDTYEIDTSKNRLRDEAEIAAGFGVISERLKEEDLRTLFEDVNSKPAWENNEKTDYYATHMALARLVPSIEFGSTELGVTSLELMQSVAPEDLTTLTAAAQEIAERLAALYAETATLKDAFLEEYGVDPDTESGRRLMEEKGIKYQELDKTEEILREREAEKGDYVI